MKKRHFIHTIIASALGAAALAVAPLALGQGYPNKPIKFVVPFTAGSSSDIIGRAFADAMGRSMGQPIIVENRPGAGGTIGAAMVAKADADGYTLLVNSSAHTVNPAIYPNLPFDTLKDFTSVAGLGAVPNVLIAPPGKYKNLPDFIAQIKAKPANSLNYASAGIGSATHLNAEKFMMMAGLDLQHIPFKGTPEAITEVAAGRLEFYMAPINAAIGLVKDGKIAAMGVSTAKRSPLLPDVPTTSEAGAPGSDYALWVGMFAPSRTPVDIVTRLNMEAMKAANSPELKDRLTKMGADAMPGNLVEFEAFVRKDLEISGQVAKRAKMQAQ